MLAYGFSLVRLLVLILIRAILEQSINNKNGEHNNFMLECLLLIFTYRTNGKFIVIFKPQTLNDGR